MRKQKVQFRMVATFQLSARKEDPVVGQALVVEDIAQQVAPLAVFGLDGRDDGISFSLEDDVCTVEVRPVVVLYNKVRICETSRRVYFCTFRLSRTGSVSCRNRSPVVFICTKA